MTVASMLSPISLTQFFYDSGQLVRPARLFFYTPGTTSDIAVYTDAGLTVPHEQPVLTGGSGRTPPIYVGTTPYRVRVYDSRGGLVEDIDYLPGAADTTPGAPGSILTPAEQQSLLKTGDFVWMFHNSSVTRPGFVRANGGLIGPPAAPVASDIEMYHADAHNLFVWLWGQDSSGTLQVLPSKGASAEADWAANKALRIPDLCGRALRGMDGMGGAAKSRLTGVTMTPAVQTTPGTFGGVATHTITTAQMPSHGHTVNANGTGIWINDPGHAHGVPGSTDTDPSTGTAGARGGPAAYPHMFNTVGNTTDITISDPTHTHTVNPAGGGAATPTVGPFLTATCFIKL